MLRMDGRTYVRTDGQRENSIPTTNKVCGGIIIEQNLYGFIKCSW